MVLLNKKGDYLLVFLLFIVILGAVGVFLNKSYITLKKIPFSEHTCQNGLILLGEKNSSEVIIECLEKCLDAFPQKEMLGVIKCEKKRIYVANVVFENAVCLCRQSIWDYMSKPSLK